MWYFEIALSLLVLGIVMGLILEVWHMVVPATLGAILVGVVEARSGAGAAMVLLRGIETLATIELGFFIGAVLGQWRVQLRLSGTRAPDRRIGK